MSSEKKPSPPKETPQPDTDPAQSVAAALDAPRVVSLIVLVVVVVTVAVMFFRVMSAFLVPLFLAAVLAVVFDPLHQWVKHRMKGRRSLSSLASTTLVSLTVLVPTCYLAWMAANETHEIARQISDQEKREQLVAKIKQNTRPVVEWARKNLNPTKATEQPDELPQGQASQPAEPDLQSRAIGETMFRYAEQYALPWVVDGFVAAVSLMVGMSIMIFALYFFFADGASMIDTAMRLSPLDNEYEHELLEQFSSVSRAVVLATLLSAVVQGLLAGIGYFFAMEAGSPIFLLTLLTILLSIIPFLGAMAVWAPVALWVFFMQDGGFWPGILLAIYGFGLVSTIDNFIKPYVLHGQSNMHPLLALLSVLGGMQFLGPIGIVVGPMLVAFLHALLEMLRRELDLFRESTTETAKA